MHTAQSSFVPAIDDVVETDDGNGFSVEYKAVSQSDSVKYDYKVVTTKITCVNEILLAFACEPQFAVWSFVIQQVTQLQKALTAVPAY